jgi:hypothetical protein
MNEFELMSLLPRGTKTWSGGDFETTVDLVLPSADLASSTVKCMIHGKSTGPIIVLSRPNSIAHLSYLLVAHRECCGSSQVCTHSIHLQSPQNTAVSEASSHYDCKT